MTKIAVVAFNLGGPDGPEAIEPFLFNLFNDPAIIGLPGPLRWAVAKLISRKRAPFARGIYDQIGGRSPLLEETEAQASAVQRGLSETGDVRVWPCMRYWHPRSDAVAANVKAFGPDLVVLLPLYPQFSTTTSASSVKDWMEAAEREGIRVPTVRICCYPTEPGFVEAMADLTARGIAEAEPKGAVRVLFSAHGLPKKIVDRGDPYPRQVEASAKAIFDRLGRPELDWLVCYQSRVGPLEWIGPATDSEVTRAGRDGKAAVVVPLAFVSEHSETLVELDIEYRHLAEQAGVAAYVRVPAVGTHPAFIAGLCRMVETATEEKSRLWVAGATEVCRDPRCQCPRLAEEMRCRKFAPPS